MTTQEQLAPALHNAWALNKPSVVEVVTNRHSNVEHHRGIQAAVRQAVAQAALQAAPTPDTSGVLAGATGLAIIVHIFTNARLHAVTSACRFGRSDAAHLPMCCSLPPFRDVVHALLLQHVHTDKFGKGVRHLSRGRGYGITSYTNPA